VTHHVINATQSIKNSSMAVMYDEDLIVALTYNPAPPTSNSQASHTETPNDKLLEDGIKLSAASEEAMILFPSLIGGPLKPIKYMFS